MRFFWFVLVLFILGCSEGDGEYVAPVYDVPEEFQPFVDSFIQQASDRGLSIEISNLIITYDSSFEFAFCAQCNSSDVSKPVQKIITVSAILLCGDNDMKKEALIFHELGHCVLGRAHSDELLPSGDPKSMMVKDNVSVYSPCVYQLGDEECNFVYRRDYYLDELFDESTPVPYWGK